MKINKKYIFLAILFASMVVFAASRVGRFDKLFSTSATITTLTTTTTNGGNLSLAGNSLFQLTQMGMLI